MAFVEDLNGPWLFESMYTDDPEAGKLGALPGMEEILNGYPLQTAYIIVCSNIVYWVNGFVFQNCTPMYSKLRLHTFTYARYNEKFTAICQEIFEFGLKEHEKREAEIASFFSCLEEATQENNNTGVKHIHSYIEYKKKVWSISL